MTNIWLTRSVGCTCVLFVAVSSVGGKAPSDPIEPLRLEVRLIAVQNDIWPDLSSATDVPPVLQMVAMPKRVGDRAKSLPKFIKVQYHYSSSMDGRKVDFIKKSGGNYAITARRYTACDETVKHMNQSSGISPVLSYLPSWTERKLKPDLKLQCFVVYSPDLVTVK